MNKGNEYQAEPVIVFHSSGREKAVAVIYTTRVSRIQENDSPPGWSGEHRHLAWTLNLHTSQFCSALIEDAPILVLGAEQ
jgi:hypothetical protein